MPQPSSKVRPAVLVLALVAVLMLGAAGTMAVLWNGARQDREKASQALDDATRQVGDKRAELADTRKSIDEADADIKNLESQNTELRKCGDPAKDSIIAARDSDQPALAAAFERVRVYCR